MGQDVIGNENHGGIRLLIAGALLAIRTDSLHAQSALLGLRSCAANYANRSAGTELPKVTIARVSLFSCRCVGW